MKRLILCLGSLFLLFGCTPTSNVTIPAKQVVYLPDIGDVFEAHLYEGGRLTSRKSDRDASFVREALSRRTEASSEDVPKRAADFEIRTFSNKGNHTFRLWYQESKRFLVQDETGRLSFVWQRDSTQLIRSFL